MSKESEEKLMALIREGPDKRYKARAIVLEHYLLIVEARQCMRDWKSIADALGFDGLSGRKQLADCFRRVDADIKAGKLKVPAASVANKSRPAQQEAVTGDDGYGGFGRSRAKPKFDDDK